MADGRPEVRDRLAIICGDVSWSYAQFDRIVDQLAHGLLGRGMVADPGGVTGLTHHWAVRALSALARRWIASGVGCDARLEAQPGPSVQKP